MPDIRVTAGTGLGAGLIAMLLALPALLPPAFANEEPVRTLLSTARELFPAAVDPTKLYKWSHEFEPAISTEVLRERTIRKIGFGRTEFVSVVETSSGTYSTDAMQSPLVEYPGIHKRRIADDTGMAYWSDGSWITQQPLTAGSFVTVTRFDGGSLIVTEDGMCVTTASGVACN